MIEFRYDSLLGSKMQHQAVQHPPKDIFQIHRRKVISIPDLPLKFASKRRKKLTNFIPPAYGNQSEDQYTTSQSQFATAEQ